MTVKRDRAGSSSAYPDTSVATATSRSPAKVVKMTVAAETPPPPKLLTVASPGNYSECDRTRIGGFLEQCHYCRKRIAEGSDVFMYSNLCAFCSIECRDCQINLDQMARQKPED